MSGGLDDTDPSPSTRDLVLQLLDSMGRVESALGIGEAETHPLSARVNQLLVELAEFKAETVDALDDVDRSLAAIQGYAVRRYSRLDERAQALDHPEETKP